MKKKNKEILRLKIITIIVYLVVFTISYTNEIYAESDPLSVITNTSDYMFMVIKLIGTMMLGYGVMQLGLSFKSHDPSQKETGIMYIAGGAIIAFAKEVVNTITKTE